MSEDDFAILMQNINTAFYQQYPHHFYWTLQDRFYLTYIYPKDSNVWISLEDITEKRRQAHLLYLSGQRMMFAERIAKLGYWELDLALKRFYWSDEMYKISDLCITRAGAMTISELALAHKPSILIPLPTAAENHQFFNAKVLENVGAAKIIEQKDLTEELLNSTVEKIIKDNNRLIKMGENAAEVIVKDVDEKIYNCIKQK